MSIDYTLADRNRDTNIERIADALERIAAALEALKPKETPLDQVANIIRGKQ